LRLNIFPSNLVAFGQEVLEIRTRLRGGAATNCSSSRRRAKIDL